MSRALNSPLGAGENPKQIMGEGTKGIIADDGKVRIINMGDNEYDMYIFSINWRGESKEGAWRAVKTYKNYELVELAIAILEGVPDEEYIISKRVTVDDD